MAVATLALGVAAFELAETAAAEVLLAAFMVSIALVWAAKLLDHIGCRTSAPAHRRSVGRADRALSSSKAFGGDGDGTAQSLVRVGCDARSRRRVPSEPGALQRFASGSHA